MRISKKSDLPKWFNLDNYKGFSRLDDDEIIHQIIWRRNDEITEVFKQEDYFETYAAGGIYKRWAPNCTIKKVVSERKRISSGRIFQPLSFSDVYDINERIEGLGNKNLHEFDHVNAVFSPFFNGDVFCSITLTSQDDLILDELRMHLPKWREELGIELEQLRIKNSWDVVRNKIISYQAMAFRDLMMWQKATGNQITNGVLTVALYPEGEYDSTNIVQTIKPFVENLFTDAAIEKFDSEISSKKRG